MRLTPRRARLRLTALLDEHDVWRAHSLDEQLGGPADLGDQRVRLDPQLVHVVRSVRQPGVLAKLDVIPRHAVAADVRLRRIRLAVDGFVEGHLVAAVGRQIETRGEIPRLLEGRALAGVDVGSRQVAGHRIRSRAATRRQPHERCDKNGCGLSGHIESYEWSEAGFHDVGLLCPARSSTSRIVKTPFLPTSQSAAFNAPSAKTRRSRARWLSDSCSNAPSKISSCVPGTDPVRMLVVGTCRPRCSAAALAMAIAVPDGASFFLL